MIAQDLERLRADFGVAIGHQRAEVERVGTCRGELTETPDRVTARVAFGDGVAVETGGGSGTGEGRHTRGAAFGERVLRFEPHAPVGVAEQRANSAGECLVQSLAMSCFVSLRSADRAHASDRKWRRCGRASTSASHRPSRRCRAGRRGRT